MKTLINFPGVAVAIDVSKLYKFVRHRVTKNEEAEDLVQDTLCTAVASALKFRGESLPVTWIYGIALNKIKNHYSKCRCARDSIDEGTETSDALLEGAGDASPSAEALAESNQDAECLHKALQKLDAAYRHVVQLYFFEFMTYEEISHDLGIPIGTVRSRLNRAKKLLASLVEVP